MDVALSSRQGLLDGTGSPFAGDGVAVVGAACRLPGGVASPASFWELLQSGTDAVGAVPDGRWDPQDLASLTAGATRPLVWEGGFLSDDIGAFDAEFFGISRREAVLIDPQQRLLLELAWEACEHAGIAPRALAGIPAGVFTGLCNPDHTAYVHWLPAGGGPYSVTGNQYASSAGRISHVLGLRGPSMAVDTGCSSGLATVHLACRSLRHGECGLAFAGAVNLLLSPLTTVAYNELGVLSPTGRCRPFDEDGDGYARAEGGVVLVLKRLADAVRDGDRVLAVLRGTAVNHDGATSRFAVPSGQAQQEVCRAALAAAGVRAEDVAMVEAHGPGTPAGDRIEFASLSAVYGRGDVPCALGSVKSNLGHTESAAGMVGLLKAILAVRHAVIPPTLHFRSWQPGIDPADSRLYMPVDAVAWPAGPRLAAVCSYGVAGTNVHAVVGQAPEAERLNGAAADEDRPRVFALSASGPDALKTAARRLAHWLAAAGREAPLDDVADTLARRRSHADERLAVVARSRDVLVERLEGWLSGRTDPLVTADWAREAQEPGPVWVFSGHGSQWPGMARQLLDDIPEFADTVAELDALVAAESGFSPYELLRQGAKVTRVDQVQPLIFTVQVGLAAALRARGLRPAAVAGHSMGEVAAAVACGALSVEDGVKVICRRSQVCLSQARAGTGAMTAVELPHDQVARELEEAAAEADIAMLAAPSSTVIGGWARDVDRLVREWNARGIAARRIAVDFASHCRLTEPLLGDLERSLCDLSPREPDVPFYTTVLEDPRTLPSFDAGYWVANLRRPVRATAATEALAEDGYRVFQELSPHPVAVHPLTATLDACGAHDAVVVPSLSAEQHATDLLWMTAARLHCAGQPVDWRYWLADGRPADVPTTSWERQSLLIDLAAIRVNRGALREQPPQSAHGAKDSLSCAPEVIGQASTGLDQGHPMELPAELPVQTVVTEHLRDLLQLRRRRIHASAAFTDLGLDSLHAASFRDRLQQTLGREIPLAVIWQHPTIAALSMYLGAERAAAADEASSREGE
ncbi:type I polyketide synthase [Streptomyces noursei]|uniref:type I polyketide synthase n=1 Tax=Streptomyces noursei TaxID=1971 RepID=UPI001679C76A|nr:type I polyketide synthase [Streptomyces noursei]MCZ1021166.1 type I polyketide synthase [Streptomyces noursei]GGX54095.1 hypothetical protein GCM10010341_89120 [Streptomyces noursei]